MDVAGTVGEDLAHPHAHHELGAGIVGQERVVLVDAGDAVQAQSLAAQAATDNLDIARTQYEQGAINYLSLLTAQQQYQQARLNLVTAVSSRYADTAALFQALGGGWWHRDGAADPSLGVR